VALISGHWDKKLQEDDHVNPTFFCTIIVDYLNEMMILSENNPRPT